MKISVIGCGYVGLVSGTCFSEMGNKVTIIDNNHQKIKDLKNGIIPIYEPGLESLIIKNINNSNLFFTTNFKEGINSSDFIFIAVGTPMGEDGSADLKHVIDVGLSIGRNLDTSAIIVNKSTVPVGTGGEIKKIIERELKLRKKKLDIYIVSNPEFLKEGNAIQDFMKPDRIIIGTNEEIASNKIKELYSPFFRSSNRFITMDLKSAEMTKYASNAMLATKISFINEIANLCEKVGADVNKVRIGIGSDNRIGYSFIYPGVGYGGSCFPKDVKALIKIGNDVGYECKLIKATESVNDSQKSVMFNKIKLKFQSNIKNRTFAIWGLSFKPETNDIREAPSINLISKLINEGSRIIAYDPQAINETKRYFFNNKNIMYSENKYDLLEKCDALVLLTEWKEFRSPDFNLIKKKLKNSIIFDGRNQYNEEYLKTVGFDYIQIGKL